MTNSVNQNQTSKNLIVKAFNIIDNKVIFTQALEPVEYVVNISKGNENTKKFTTISRVNDTLFKINIKVLKDTPASEFINYYVEGLNLIAKSLKNLDKVQIKNLNKADMLKLSGAYAGLLEIALYNPIKVKKSYKYTIILQDKDGNNEPIPTEKMFKPSIIEGFTTLFSYNEKLYTFVDCIKEEVVNVE